MALTQLDHYTICTTPEKLAATRDFYADVLGLEDGERPPFRFPGHWLYVGGRPVVHLMGTASGDAAPAGSGSVDHVAFAATGLDAMRDQLRARGMAFDERTVPGMGLHQIFLHDPNGIKVEINYQASEA